MYGARWIPDRHLAVKLLESPENEDGYTSVHFAFPIPAGSRSLFLSPCPPFLVLLLLFPLLFLLRLLLLFPLPRVFARIRLERKKHDLKDARRCSRCATSDGGAVAVAVAVAIGWLAGWLMVPTDAADGASAYREERRA